MPDAPRVPLKPQAIHLPFEAGPYRMAMGFSTVPEVDWFELDNRYVDEMAERRRLLSERRTEVFAALPRSDEARVEALTEIARNLTRWHPNWFTLEDSRLHNHLTQEQWDVGTPTCDPFEIAGLLVQEDLCLIQDGLIKDDAAAPLLTAAVLCFPSRWRLTEKIGRPLTVVHAPVPFYAERLAGPVDRFMRHVKPDHIAVRLNWSVLDDPTLFQPTGKWRDARNIAVTAANAGDTLFLRVERQTLRRLPRTGAILFGIRVHVYQLHKAITAPETAARLANAVRALPGETVHYKSLLPIRDALLAWLDGRARTKVAI